MNHHVARFGRQRLLARQQSITFSTPSTLISHLHSRDQISKALSSLSRNVSTLTKSRSDPDITRQESLVSRNAACKKTFQSSRPFSAIRRLLEEKNTQDKIAQELQDVKDTTKQGITSTSTSKLLIDRLPHLHRPTKDELLAAASGFWHRLSIRFKWFSIRSARPFNFDDIFAFASWIFWGHVLWIIIGTTTFVSLAIFAVNTVFAQETLAKWIGNYLTKSSGLRVVFESAIVPTWKDGVITFNNVFVSRRPGMNKRDRSVSKGSQTAAVAAAAAAYQSEREQDVEENPTDDGNYTQFDVAIDTVNVTLSFTKWFNGRGLLRDVEVHGVRGVVDRTFVHNTGNWGDPASWRHEHHAGDFEIDDFKMEDVLLTVYQPNGFRPFTISVFNCELPRLRKQWLFYDFLSAKTMSGSFDNSLFTIHPRQVHNYTGVPLIDGAEAEPSHWKKQSRLRIDGLKIDHLNRGVEGPFGWIYEGNVDIVADVMIPNDYDLGIAQIMSELYDQVEASVTNNTTKKVEDTTINNRDQSNETTLEQQRQKEVLAARQRDERYTIFDIRIHLNDVRASVPIFNNELGYVNNAVVRPIVAYINSRRSFIPVNCRIVKSLRDFDGSWTFFDSGLLDELSREIYDAFVRDIQDGDIRTRRIKKVGLWTLQVAAQALFLGLAGQLA